MNKNWEKKLMKNNKINTQRLHHTNSQAKQQRKRKATRMSEIRNDKERYIMLNEMKIKSMYTDATLLSLKYRILIFEHGKAQPMLQTWRAVSARVWACLFQCGLWRERERERKSKASKLVRLMHDCSNWLQIIF